jgi:hypothetical protein
MARIELAGAVLLCPREEVGCGAVERRSYVAGPILPPQKMGGAAAQLAGVGCSRRRNRAALSRGALGPSLPPEESAAKAGAPVAWTDIATMPIEPPRRS